MYPGNPGMNMYTITVTNREETVITTCSTRVYDEINGLSVSKAKWDEADKYGLSSWFSDEKDHGYIVSKTGTWKTDDIEVNRGED